MDREAWHAAAQGVAKSLTRLSDWTELKKHWDSISLQSNGNFTYRLYSKACISKLKILFPSFFSFFGLSLVKTSVLKTFQEAKLAFYCCTVQFGSH